MALRSSFWPLRPFLTLVLIGALTAGLAACGDDDDDDDDGGDGATPGGDISGETVDVLAIWGEEEVDDFNAMVDPWKADTGADVDFTGTRDINSILTTRVEGGDPPDVAFPAALGIFQDLAREGELTPLSACPGLEEKVRENYAESLIELGTIDDELYGVFMKAGNKATIWYNVNFFEEHEYEPLTADATFDDLLALTEEIAADREAGVHDAYPWSDAQEIGGGSGFPGSDWVQQIVLGEFGPDVYDQWVAHEIPYNDPQIKQAWEMFGQVVLDERYTLGGPERALATRFSEGSIPLFEDPPAAAMHYMGSFNAGFITDPELGFPEGLEPGTDFDFFPFPGGGVTGDGNIMMLFNSDPATCAFADWMASAEAQEIWVSRGGFTSLNSEVDLEAYPTDLDRKVAEQLTDPDTVFRFDADDAMPSGVGGDNGAVFTGILAYLSGDDLDEILQGIEDAFP
ncbi:MAG TPA: ABC transporter substrate-binding protein [Dehalococcoidia bacterium]|nr:ABC transporter substrate-binding protein [Dehalococcoidia bacterium]